MLPNPVIQIFSSWKFSDNRYQKSHNISNSSHAYFKSYNKKVDFFSVGTSNGLGKIVVDCVISGVFGFVILQLWNRLRLSDELFNFFIVFNFFFQNKTGFFRSTKEAIFIQKLCFCLGFEIRIIYLAREIQLIDFLFDWLSKVHSFAYIIISIRKTAIWNSFPPHIITGKSIPHFSSQKLFLMLPHILNLSGVINSGMTYEEVFPPKRNLMGDKPFFISHYCQCSWLRYKRTLQENVSMSINVHFQFFGCNEHSDILLSRRKMQNFLEIFFKKFRESIISYFLQLKHYGIIFAEKGHLFLSRAVRCI